MKHRFVSAKSDGGDATLVRPSNWNDEHTDPIYDLLGDPDTAFEFNTSSLTGLTAMGTADAEDANTTILGHYFVNDNDSTQVGRYASVSTPFTAICKITDALTIRNYSYAGMFCGESTPGKMVWTGMIYADSNRTALVRTFATPGDGSPGSPALYIAPQIDTILYYPAYFAIVANSNTDVDYYYSRTGQVWYPLLLTHNNSMTIGSVGLSIGQYNALSMQAAYDFLRIWNSVESIPSFT